MAQEGLEIRPVSVNLSRASLCRQGVALAYKRILEGYGLSTWMVPLEVTESAMISDDAVISVLQEFYRYGFRIEIDDFGARNPPCRCSSCRLSIRSSWIRA